MADITMPQLGETVTEGTITRWFKQVGDQVAEDEILFEVSTDKVDSEVPSPVSGTLTEIRVPEGDLVEVGVVLAVISDDAAAPVATAEPVAPEPLAAVPEPLATVPAAEPPAAAPATAEATGGSIEITLPALGEAVTEGTITRWFKQVGDQVAEDEVLYEVSTDKVDSEVPSPASGVLAEIRVPEGELVEVGVVLAVLTPEGAAAPAPEPAAAAPAPAAEPVAAPAAKESVRSGLPLSPVVRRLINDSGIDLAGITGTGVGGRITRADVESAISAQGLSTTSALESAAPADAASAPGPAPGSVAVAAAAAAAAAAPTPAAPAPAAPAPAAPARIPDAPARIPDAPAPAAVPAAPAPAMPPDETSTLPLSNIRRRTGEHMVMSKATSPHVLTAVEVDFERVEIVRQAHKAEWKAEEGFSLTYLPFIARAVVDAIREFPHMNATVGENELIIHDEVNLAIAVDLDFQGLLAPVVKAADSKRLRHLSREIVDVATRARSKKLTADEVMGGTFTITNPGQYGTFMQFPIINQPQVAILSTDGIRRKPVVITDSSGTEGIAIHSVGLLALAWDHRAFDGAYVAAFMNQLRNIIETRDWESEIS